MLVHHTYRQRSESIEWQSTMLLLFLVPNDVTYVKECQKQQTADARRSSKRRD